MKFPVLILALATVCSAVIYDRPCRSITMVQDFALEKYAGMWFEVRRYETSPQLNGDCSTFLYQLDNPDHPMAMEVTHQYAFRNNGTIVQRPGSLSQRGGHRHGSNVGHLILNFADAPEVDINYCLVASDYENYAVVWSCQDLENGTSNEDAWIMSSETTLRAEFDEIIRLVVEDELDGTLFTNTYQGSSCQAIGA